MLRHLIVSSICLLILYPQHSHGDETICTINGKKALHRVNERFLSISIDPAVLLTGLNLSDVSLQMARHLSPAFIRIAGPSTQFVKYQDIEKSLEDVKNCDEDETITITSSMWFGINEWLASANLTPIFGVNDVETIRDVWNPKSTLPLLEISDKLNVTCYWQLGYDTSNKTEARYKEDLLIFRHILDAFPDKKDIWKIIGSDITNCETNQLNHPENTRRILDELNGVLEAAVFEQSSSDITDSVSTKLLTAPIKPKLPLWTTIPKTTHTITFSSAIKYAQEIGEAAKAGYQVVFRQPRLHEFFADTPVYWVSALFKNLMGRTVLDVKTTSYRSSLSVFAHCTKKQNHFVRSGAMTVMVVNNNTYNDTVLLKFGSFLMRNTEVESYILSSTADESGETYLNGIKLGEDDILREQLDFKPKLRLAKIINYLSLQVPSRSVGFFVLPVAHLPVCTNEETDLESLVEEISHDQNIPFSGEISVELMPRNFVSRSSTLKELHELMEKELDTDTKYYKGIRPKTKILHPKLRNELNFHEGRNFFIERAKLAENQRKHLDNDHRKIEIKKIVREPEPMRELELELTSAEIRKILTDRAKKKASKKNIIFTSEELEEIMEKATAKFLKDRNTNIKIVRKTKRSISIPRDKKDINMKLLKLKSMHNDRREQIKQLLNSRHNLKAKRGKRDINMNLLKLKTEIMHNSKAKPVHKTRFENNEEKVATLRGSEQVSTEQLKDDSEDVDDVSTGLPKGEILAELASSEESIPTEKTIFKGLPIPKPTSDLNPILPLPKIIDLKFPTKTPQILKPFDIKTEILLPTVHLHNGDHQQPELRKPEHPQILELSDDYSDDTFSLNDDLDYAYIHEYVGHEQKELEKLVKSDCEFGEIPLSKKKDNELPDLTNRGHSDVSNGKVRDYLEEVEGLDIANDYGDLDSNEEKPLRLKRSVNEIQSPSSNKSDLNDGIVDFKKHQIKLLKHRLSNKKKLDLINKSIHDGIAERARSARSVVQKYKSLTAGLKENLKKWQPSLSTERLSRTKEKWHNFEERFRNKKSKRNVNNLDFNALQNELDYYNNIVHESKLIRKSDNGNYEVVFNGNGRDDSDLDNSGASNENKLDHDIFETGKPFYENTVTTSNTNSDLIVEITTQSITSNQNNTELEIEEQKKLNNIMNSVGSNQCDSRNVFQDMLDKFKEFFEGLGGKLKTYLIRFLH